MKKHQSSKGGKTNFRSSLMSRYLLLMLFAVLFLPIIFPLASITYLAVETVIHGKPEGLKYGDSNTLKSMWHKEAAALGKRSAPEIDQRMQQLKGQYPEASMFWVNARGETQLQLPKQATLPAHWTPADAIQFMKTSVNGDPYTVIAFIGSENAGPDFMVLQMPRSVLTKDSPIGVNTPFYIVFILIVFCFLVILSLLFFRHIRKRLMRLELAMTVHSLGDLPKPIVQKKQDEIGQLEGAFNRMIEQLSDSKQREHEEEELRKRLISNLSHDLRTPLTVINSHIYTLRKEELSVSGQGTIKQMEYKIEGLSRLIENLLSYTLMTSGRYPLKLEQSDVLRLARESAAAWYPLWEKEGIEAEVDLPGQPLIWHIDKEGFRRILDNLFQNVVRHAAKGKYIGISVEQRKEGSALVITDHGDGQDTASDHKGSGIGLAIVDYLVREMNLGWQINTTSEGMRVYIYAQGEAANILNEI